VIYNPVAGWRRRRRFAHVVALLRRFDCAVEVCCTARPGDAEIMARAASSTRCDLVVAAGGDGTINEVINGLAGSALPLALLPLGTANVLAAEIGLGASAMAIAKAIAFAPLRPVFLGDANGRRFALMIGVGFDARVVEGLNLRLKRAVGKFAYVLSALGEFLRYRPRRYQVEIDGTAYPASSVVIAKGRYYGGRFIVAPEARLDQPSLYVALFERSGRWNLVRYAAAFLGNRLDRLPDVRILPATAVMVSGEAGEPIQADGDLLAVLPLRVTLVRQPLALIAAEA
jgi:YegS/Rv2252/BmrU family lipid kinase